MDHINWSEDSHQYFSTDTCTCMWQDLICTGIFFFALMCHYFKVFQNLWNYLQLLQDLKLQNLQCWGHIFWKYLDCFFVSLVLSVLRDWWTWNFCGNFRDNYKNKLLKQKLRLREAVYDNLKWSRNWDWGRQSMITWSETEIKIGGGSLW